MTVSKTIAARDFNILDPMRSQVSPEGHITVPEGYDGFVIYGPYWPMRAGLYVVRPQIIPQAEAKVYGVLEICDRGALLEQIPLTPNCFMSVRLPDILGLEIRIKAAGVPFVLTAVLLIHAPDDLVEDHTIDPSATGPQIAATDTWLKALASPKAEFETLKSEFHSLTKVSSSLDALAEAIHADVDPAVVGALADGFDFDAHLEAWISKCTRVRVVDAWGEHLAENAQAISKLGFDIEAVRISSSDRPALQDFYARALGRENLAGVLSAVPDNEYDNSQSLDWFSELQRVQGGFSRMAAVAGEAFTVCPFTGAVLNTKHCLVVPSDGAKQVFLFYKFRSIYDFYLIVTSYSGSKNFIYCPEKNVALRLHAPLFEWGECQSAINQFYRLMLPRARKVASYLQAETERAVLCGTLQNVGHFFWNELSGIYEFGNAGFLDGIEYGLSYASAFIAPYDILPDALVPQRDHYKTEAALCDAALDRKLFVIRPTGSIITPELAAEIRRVANEHCSPEQKKNLVKAKSTDYILWVALRNHNKVWLEQVDGILALADELSKTYEKATIFIDGTPDCKDIAREIFERAPKNVSVYDGTSVSIYDTLIWAFEIDSYIATIGSGLTFVTWIAAKPGIAHSETHHMHQMPFWGDVRPDSPKPVNPQFSDIEDMGDRGYCDYKIAPAVMLGLFRNLTGHSTAQAAENTRSLKT